MVRTRAWNVVEYFKSGWQDGASVGGKQEGKSGAPGVNGLWWTKGKSCN